MTKHIAAVLALCPLFLSCGMQEPGGGPAISIPAQGSMDQRIHQGVNAYRASKGKPALPRDASLDSLARAHSASMMRRQSKALVSHDGFSGRAQTARSQLGINGFGENVGYGTGGKAAAGQIVGLWIHSRGHRANMLGAWSVTGVGTAAGDDGTVFATQVFGRR